MKFVVVPADVKLVDKRGATVMVKLSDADPVEPWIVKHEDFVYDHITGSDQFAKGGGDGARRQRRVRQKFEDCKPGDVIGIEEADFRLVRPIIDGITWAPSFARYAEQMLPHLEAWEKAEAQDEDWKKKYDEEQKARTNGASVSPVEEVAEETPRAVS